MRVQCNGSCIETEKGVFVTGILSDLTLQSTIDPVTGLRCNHDFRVTLSQITEHTDSCGILVLGIDGFKRINDLYSYAFGDDVIRTFAQRIEEHLPFGASLYRLDGDGFGILYPKATLKRLVACYDTFQELAQQSMKFGDIRISFTISGGICQYPEDGSDCETLYRNARIALNFSKKKGRNQVTIYSEELSCTAQYTMLLLEKLRESVTNGFEGFTLHYQPLIYADSGDLYGCEALLRWVNPAFPDGVSPFEFVPVLENSGLMISVGKWVLKAALKQCAKWTQYMPDFQMSINVTCEQFEDPDFRFFVMDALGEYGLDPTLITLELTESGQINDTDKVSRAFDFFRSQGIKIAFDDFGTGYDSLSIFRLLSADELKIDRSFLERLTYDVTDQKIIQQIITLCHSMNMDVCVEGIETKEVEKIVKQLGPKLFQGYYYNKPMTAEAFDDYYFKQGHMKSQPMPELPHVSPERQNSMVYSEFKPAQPMSMEDIINHAHAGIFQVGMDQEFTFLTCNEGYRRMLGYTAKEIEEKFANRALGFVHPDDMEYVNEEIRRQLGRGDTVTIEFRVVRADGVPLWILGTGNVVRGRHGTSSLVVVIVENDRLKKKNLAMEKENRRNQMILSNLPVGIKYVRFDADFTIEYISPSFLSLMGYTENEIQTQFEGKYINLIYEADRQQVINDVLEQIKVGNVVTLRYRSPCKDGRIIWVETISRLCEPDENGIQHGCSCVVEVKDITQEGEKKREINLANRYQDAAKQWGDILFEYDFVSGEITFSDNYRGIFGKEPRGYMETEIQYIYEPDRNLLLSTLQTVHQGKQPDPIEIRVKKPDGSYRWYSMTFNKPDYIGDTPVAVLGKIYDIDEEKREREELLEQSRQDPLTGLLNKSTMEERIRQILGQATEGQHYALFMFDIDNFKRVNDNFGHIFGDELLREIARRLRVFLSEKDIVGRAGGDEFMAFLEFNGDLSVVENKGRQLMDTLHEPFFLDGVEYRLGVSVGISCYPTDGLQFYDLFRRADSALYRVKEQGKNDYCIFSR